MLWVRDANGMGDPSQDALRFYYAGRQDIFSRSLVPAAPNLILRSFVEAIGEGASARLDAVRDRALGDKSLRTRSKPTFANGSYSGGTQYERHSRAVGIVNGGRCYTNGNSAQTASSLVSVNANAKMTDSEMDEHQELQRDINLVGAVRTP